MTKHVLVTGGAGYIGSHACKVLSAKGYVPVTYDNLSTGWAQAVKYGPFVQGDLMDRAALDAAFAEYKPVAVMHFAAFSQVGEAMSDPGKYWRNNVLGSLSLAEAAVANGVLDFAFSSKISRLQIIAYVSVRSSGGMYELPSPASDLSMRR